ncbi:hypothetical protein pb186bvf_016130 [Paramecium bursaria]
MFFILLTLAFAKEYQLIVYEGNFYSSPELKFESKSSETVQAKIKLGSSAGLYFIPQQDEQARCMASWNKLWGYSRCLGSQHHEDSDRFVFRRDQSCLTYKNGMVTEKEGCGKLIELAAYAYDNSEEPFNNQGRLLIQLNTKILPEIFYNYRLIFLDTITLYELYDENMNHLESKAIQHRKCFQHQSGYRLTLYFGGVCPAPTEIMGYYIV